MLFDTYFIYVIIIFVLSHRDIYSISHWDIIVNTFLQNIKINFERHNL